MLQFSIQIDNQHQKVSCNSGPRGKQSYNKLCRPNIVTILKIKLNLDCFNVSILSPEYRGCFDEVMSRPLGNLSLLFANVPPL